MKTAQASTDKWAAAMATAGTAYTAGINAVQTAPGILAAAQSAKRMQRLIDTQAKWEKNVASVDLATWKNLCTTKGVANLSTGAAAAKPKVLAFMTSFLAYLAAGQAQINAMPTTTFGEAQQKALQQMAYNHAYPGYR